MTWSFVSPSHFPHGAQHCFCSSDNIVISRKGWNAIGRDFLGLLKPRDLEKKKRLEQEAWGPYKHSRPSHLQPSLTCPSSPPHGSRHRLSLCCSLFLKPLLQGELYMPDHVPHISHFKETSLTSSQAASPFKWLSPKPLPSNQKPHLLGQLLSSTCKSVPFYNHFYLLASSPLARHPDIILMPRYLDTIHPTPLTFFIPGSHRLVSFGHSNWSHILDFNKI